MIHYSLPVPKIKDTVMQLHSELNKAFENTALTK